MLKRFAKRWDRRTDNVTRFALEAPATPSGNNRMCLLDSGTIAPSSALFENKTP